MSENVRLENLPLKDSPVRRRKTANGRSEPGRTNGKVVATTTSSTVKGRLLWWDEVPRRLQFNQYIASGYRANLTYSQCLCTLFTLHNELGNVWLHLAPSIFLAGKLVWWLFYMNVPHAGAHLRAVASILACLLLSSGYHLFMAQVCGIFGVMMVPYFSAVVWGYQCQPFWQVGVPVVYYATAAIAAFSSTFAYSRMARAVPMACLTLIRSASLVHRQVLQTSSSSAIRHLFWMELLSFIGATANVLRVPERWIHNPQPTVGRKPQLLDFWGNSHQLMHLLVLIAMLHLYWAIQAESRHILNTACPL